MQCRQARQMMLDAAPTDADESALAAHLDACPACQELAMDDASLAHAMAAAVAPADDSHDETIPPPSFNDLQLQLQRERGLRSWLRSRSTTARLLLAIGAIIIAALSSLLTLRPDLGVYPTLRFGAELALLGLVATAASWHFLRPLHLPARQPATLVVWLLVALLAPTALALLPIAHTAHAASLGGAGSELLPLALKCFVYGSALAVAVFGLVVAMGRDLGHRAAVILAGCAGALAGVAALHLHCPITHRAHLLLGHASIGITIAGLTWLAHRVLVRSAGR